MSITTGFPVISHAEYKIVKVVKVKTKTRQNFGSDYPDIY